MIILYNKLNSKQFKVSYPGLYYSKQLEYSLLSYAIVLAPVEIIYSTNPTLLLHVTAVCACT